MVIDSNLQPGKSSHPNRRKRAVDLKHVYDDWVTVKFSFDTWPAQLVLCRITPDIESLAQDRETRNCIPYLVIDS